MPDYDPRRDVLKALGPFLEWVNVGGVPAAPTHPAGGSDIQLPVISGTYPSS